MLAISYHIQGFVPYTRAPHGAGNKTTSFLVNDTPFLGRFLLIDGSLGAFWDVQVKIN